MFQVTENGFRGALLIVGSIATGFSFDWVAGIAAFCLFASITPNKYPRNYFQLENKDDVN